jgi:hypothetical protein
LVAIVGSFDSARQYRPPLRGDLDLASAACEEFGAALAREGCDLLVFTSEPGYAELMVITGYVAACTAKRRGRIVARPALNQAFVLAPPPGDDVDLQIVRDTTSEWEVAFYRSLVAADAVMLIGGGRSTRIAGIVAISQGIPVVPLAAFGGGAGQVWVNLDRDRQEVTADDIALLGAPWSAGSADQLMAYMRGQIDGRRERRAVEEQAANRPGRVAAVGRAVAAAALVLALAGIALAGPPAPASVRALGLLLAAPMLAAVAGAIIRDSFGTDQDWSRAAVRGLGAGVAAVLLYVASQLLTLPGLLEELDARRLLFFVVPLGFGAGFTFDLVFERLRTNPQPVPDIAPAAPAP